MKWNIIILAATCFFMVQVKLVTSAAIVTVKTDDANPANSSGGAEENAETRVAVTPKISTDSADKNAEQENPKISTNSEEKPPPNAGNNVASETPKNTNTEGTAKTATEKEPSATQVPSSAVEKPPNNGGTESAAPGKNEGNEKPDKKENQTEAKEKPDSNETQKEDSNGGPPKIVVEETVVKNLEDKPDTTEVKNKRYYGVVTKTKDSHTDIGDKLEKTKEVTDSRSHETTQKEYNDNSLGEEAKTSTAKETEEVYNGKLLKKVQAGTGIRQKAVILDKFKTSVANKETIQQDLDNGSYETVAEKTKNAKTYNKKVKETFDDRADDGHVKARRYQFSGHKETGDKTEGVTNSYVRFDDSGTNIVAIVNKDQTSKSGVNVSTKKLTKNLAVSPEGKQSSAELTKWQNSSQNTKKIHESDIYHDTPLRELYIKDLVNEEEIGIRDRLDVKTVNLTDTAKYGKTILRTTRHKDFDRDALQHENTFTFETVPKYNSGTPLKVTLKTKVVDKNQYNYKETKNSDMKNTSRDGKSTLTENNYEIRTENYDMHKLPKLEKQHAKLQLASYVVAEPENGSEENSDGKEEEKKADVNDESDKGSDNQPGKTTEVVENHEEMKTYENGVLKKDEKSDYVTKNGGDKSAKDEKEKKTAVEDSSKTDEQSSEKK